MYALAASHAPDLHHIAVHASRFLLSIEFSRITDEMASSMGPIYLLRLYTLLTGRTREFKRLLISAPKPHEPLPQCDSKILREAWTLATAFLICSTSFVYFYGVIEYGNVLAAFGPTHWYALGMFYT